MKNLRQKGTSFGEIREKVFDKYGYTLDARDIRKLVLRKKKENRGT